MNSLFSFLLNSITFTFIIRYKRPVFLKLFFIANLLLSTCFLFAGDLRINVELQDVQHIRDEKTGRVFPTVFQGEAFKVKITVSGAGRNTGEIELEGLDKLSIDGTSRSTSITMRNSDFVSQQIYVYDVHADLQGEFKIGPAKVVHEGKIFLSNPKVLHFRVMQRKVGIPTGSVAPGQPDLFCKLIIDNSQVVVGQQILLKIRIYTSGNILQIGLEPPKLQGFLSKPIEKEYRDIEQINGKDYSVLEKRFVLFPVQPGIKTIPPVNIRFNVPVERKTRRGVNFFDDNFLSGFLGTSVQTKQTSSNSLQIHVRELPESKELVNGVGNFKSFSASVDKQEAIINEPILLVLQLEGSGNLEQVIAPKLNVPSFFKSYESKTQIKEELFDGYPAGQKIFEFILQVGKEGTCKIPEQIFNYFDTETETYKKLITKPIELHIKLPDKADLSVDPSKDSDSNLYGKELLEDKNNKKIKFKKNIHFIKEGLFSRSKNKAEPLSLWVFLILMFLPLVFYNKSLFIPIAFLFRTKLFPGYLAKKNMYRFKGTLKKIISEKQTGKIYNFFLSYFSAKCNSNRNVVNERLIEEKLYNLGLKEEKINDFLSFLNECASFSFANSVAKEIDNKKLLEKSWYWFLILEAYKG